MAQARGGLASGCAQYVKAMQSSNGFTAKTIKFVQHFRLLRVGWTANSLMSECAEKFVLEYLPVIRANNPQIKFELHRNLMECDPFVVGEYEHFRKRKMRCSWRTADQILSYVEQMSIGGDYRQGRKHGVTTLLPRGREIWNRESKGHDVFKVLSKWKGDPPEPGEITTEKHPNFIIKIMQN